MKRFSWIVTILAGVMLSWGVLSVNAQPLDTPALLRTSWQQYKNTFIQQDGRVIDFNGNVTTSEGQSYAMLRALWMRDRETFDKTYRWAKDNLQIPRGDHLFSWKWGERADHTWGAMDTTSATDADQDIALALLLAYQAWQEPAYLDDARLILKTIWERLTIITPLGRVLLPGDWPQAKRTFQLNPSYFSPYAYRVFAEMDEEHDWTELIDSSYEILNRSIAQTKTHLPPDWVEISLDNDQIKLYEAPQDPRSDFGYEAIRVYWRIGMDSLLQPNEHRTAPVLKTRGMLLRYWQVRTDTPISITWDGIVRHPDLKSGSVYGAVLPGLLAQEPAAAKELLLKKIAPNLKPGGQWNTKNDYYSQNWLWFGLAFYQASQDPPMVVTRRTSMSNRLLNLMYLPSATP